MRRRRPRCAAAAAHRSPDGRASRRHQGKPLRKGRARRRLRRAPPARGSGRGPPATPARAGPPKTTREARPAPKQAPRTAMTRRRRWTAALSRCVRPRRPAAAPTQRPAAAAPPPAGRRRAAQRQQAPHAAPQPNPAPLPTQHRSPEPPRGRAAMPPLQPCAPASARAGSLARPGPGRSLLLRRATQQHATGAAPRCAMPPMRAPPLPRSAPVARPPPSCGAMRTMRRGAALRRLRLLRRLPRTPRATRRGCAACRACRAAPTRPDARPPPGLPRGRP